ncbi:methyltransferase [Mycolicibacterium novocastrense]|nr:methyltransferase [Mycolicibacterium novocastrense]
MNIMDDNRSAVARSQEVFHPEGHDYTVGSPHLRHSELREKLNRTITAVVTESVSRRGACNVLEVGAGHGSFTDIVLAAGGTATITEMSTHSFAFLQRKFHGDARVRVVYDSDGGVVFRDKATYDVVLLISVIHHIPDYLSTVTRLCDEVLRPGGSLVTFQDPLWYPRQSRIASIVSWSSYFAWRITQGELRRGLKTRWRRLRRTFDDSEPSDLVEYHVVRDGVDEQLLVDCLAPRFESVSVDRYFSTQLPLLQRLGGKRFPANNFGITALGRRSE